MSIQSINGKKVYVVQAEPTAPAKTSSGVGWAQYVTHLRWQLWERTQQDVINELKLASASHDEKLKEVQSKRKYLRQLAADRQKELSRLSRDEQKDLSTQRRDKAKATTQARRDYAKAKTAEARRKAGAEASVASRAGKSTSGSLSTRMTQGSRDAAGAATAASGNKLSTPDSYATSIEIQGNLQTTTGSVDAKDTDNFRASLILQGIDNVRAQAQVDFKDPDTAQAEFLSNISDEWKKSLSDAQTAAGTGPSGTPTPTKDAQVFGYTPTTADPIDRSDERRRLEAELADIRKQLGGIVVPEFEVPNITEASRRRFSETVGDNAFGVQGTSRPEVIDRTEEIMNAFIQDEQSLLGPEADELDRVEAKRRGIQEAISFVNSQTRDTLEDIEPTTVEARSEADAPAPVIADESEPIGRTPIIEGVLPTGGGDGSVIDVLEPATPEPKALEVDTSTTEARQENYKDDVTKEGQKLLAGKAGKFKRLRKADLSEEERKKKVPPYVFTVEKLIGKNTPDEVLSAFEEISRTFSPDNARKAHIYLMALSEHMDKVDKPESK